MIFGAGIVDLTLIARRGGARGCGRTGGGRRRASQSGGLSTRAARRLGRRSGAWRWCSWPRCCSASRSASCCSRWCWCSCSCSSTASRTASPTGTRSRARSSIAVLLMSAIGLRDPTSAMMVGAASCWCRRSVGVDMQQDRSTGWRLGSNRTIQFRYQAVGILDGRGAVRAAREAVHERLPGAARRHVHRTRRPRSASGSRR